MMPYEGLLQIFGVIAVFEWYSMTHKKGKWAGAVRGARGSAPPPHVLARTRSRAVALLTPNRTLGSRASTASSTRTSTRSALATRMPRRSTARSCRSSSTVRVAWKASRFAYTSMTLPLFARTGRLAMLGAMSVVAACEIPGSVPLLKL